MISAQPNKLQQEKLIAKLMELPNNAVSSWQIVIVDLLMRITVGFTDGASSTEYGRLGQH
jgi:hypothetical protein